jgi:hypothetical protein
MSETLPKPKKSVALSGVPAGNTALCTVGRTGNDLHYRGYDILEVAETCGARHDQGISKAGNPQLRATMIGLAWLWVRHQPGSALARWFVERVGAAGGRMRRIGIVAVARKLLIALWRYATTGLVPEGAGLKAA